MCPKNWAGVQCQVEDSSFPGGLGRPLAPGPVTIPRVCLDNDCPAKAGNGVCDVSPGVSWCVKGVDNTQWGWGNENEVFDLIFHYKVDQLTKVMVCFSLCLIFSYLSYTKHMLALVVLKESILEGDTLIAVLLALHLAMKMCHSILYLFVLKVNLSKQCFRLRVHQLFISLFFVRVYVI